MNPLKVIKAGVTAWKTKRDWLGDGGQPVAPELAQRRSDVCRTCPHNQEMPIWEFIAGSAAFAVKQQLRLKSEMKLRVNGEEDMHVCSVCLCILSLKIHTPLKHILDSSSLDGLPDFCWIKSEERAQLFNEQSAIMSDQIKKQNLQNNDHKISGLPK